MILHMRALRFLLILVPGVPDGVWARVAGDPGRAITEHLRRWPADVLLMAATSGLGARLCGGRTGSSGTWAVRAC
jgi:hypothetical protein